MGLQGVQEDQSHECRGRGQQGHDKVIYDPTQ